MMVVDRSSFIAWTKGILLERDNRGCVVVGDRAICERAEKALVKGETIALTIGGRIVSHMKEIDGAYEEIQAESGQQDG